MGLKWDNRIVGYGAERPDDLLANPLNARVHPRVQVEAVSSVLDDVGWVSPVIVNRRSGFVVDGHLRVGEAISRGEVEVPVVYVDLSVEEERRVLAFYDATAGMAVVDTVVFAELIDGLEIPDPLVLLRDDILGVEHGGGDGGDGDEPPPDTSMSWGYATFGRTRVGCSVVEVDALHNLYETFCEENGGVDVGFVSWLAGTDR